MIFDPPVRLEHLAAAANLSLQALRKARRSGKVPQPDSFISPRACGPVARAYKLSTIRAWDPAIAERCARMLDPDPTPPDKAA